MPRKTFTAIVEKEGDGYVARCPDLYVASQGDTVEEATANLRLAVDLFLETADPAEVGQRQRNGAIIVPVVVSAAVLGYMIASGRISGAPSWLDAVVIILGGAAFGLAYRLLAQRRSRRLRTRLRRHQTPFTNLR